MVHNSALWKAPASHNEARRFVLVPKGSRLLSPYDARCIAMVSRALTASCIRASSNSKTLLFCPGPGSDISQLEYLIFNHVCRPNLVSANPRARSTPFLKALPALLPSPIFARGRAWRGVTELNSNLVYLVGLDLIGFGQQLVCHRMKPGCRSQVEAISRPSEARSGQHPQVVGHHDVPLDPRPNASGKRNFWRNHAEELPISKTPGAV